MKFRPLLLFALLVVAVFCILILKSGKVPVKPRLPEPLPLIDYGPMIRTHADQASRRNANAITSFKLELDRIRAAYDPKLEKASAQAAEECADLKSCTSLIAYLALDKMRGTSKTDEYLDDEIGPFIDPVLDSLSREFEVAVDRLESDLRRSTLLLAKDLAGLGPPDEKRTIEVPPDNLAQADLEQALRNLGINGAGIGVALVFDAAAISSSRFGEIVWAKSKGIAAKVFGKQITKAGASAAAAAVDGPVPIGDIIAIVGVIWTGVDVMLGKKEFRKDLETSLSNQLLEANAEFQKQAVGHANAMLKQHQDFQDKIGTETAAALGAPTT